AAEPLPPDVARMIGSYIENARLLGCRTGDLHLALASGDDDPAFRPEPFAGHYHRALFQAAQDRVARSLQLLKRMAPSLPGETRDLAADVLARGDVLVRKLTTLRRI